MMGPDGKVRLEPLLSPEETAKILGVSVNTLSGWRCRGRYDLPYTKVGSRVKYRRADVDKFINDRQRRPYRDTGADHGQVG